MKRIGILKCSGILTYGEEVEEEEEVKKIGVNA